MAHGVHPAVKRVEPARSDPELDRPPPDPGGYQLGTRDDAVLPPCESRDDLVRAKVANFAPYTVVNLSTLPAAALRAPSSMQAVDVQGSITFRGSGRSPCE